MKTRERELRRVGISAAVLHIKGKWRIRKKRALQQFVNTESYRQLLLLSASRCDQYVFELKKQFNDLRDREIEAAVRRASSCPFNSADYSIHGSSENESC
jgi:hypothetical protein